MTHKAYEFLKESFLFNDAFRGNYYSSYTDSKLKKELERYREHVLNNFDFLQQELTANSSPLKVFSTIKVGDISTIRQLVQSVLYLDQVVSPDPLFELTSEPSNLSISMSQLLDIPNSEIVNRKELVKTVGNMKNLVPMVNSGYLKFFPLSYYFEPDEETPLTYSESAYADALPPEVLSKYLEKVKVKSIRRSKGHLTLENSLQIGRDIAVQFKGNQIEETKFYSLLESEFVKAKDESGVLEIKMYIPDEPPTIERFQTWVHHSINQSALAHYRKLLEEFAFASKFKASYLTGSEFTNSLLGACGSKQSIEQFTADCILNFDLPFLENIGILDLMNVRNNDGEAFQKFRIELERKLRELRLETNPEKIRVQAENVMHELSVVQVADIEQKVKGLKRGVLSEIVIGLSGFVSTVATSGFSIAAMISAFSNRYESYVVNEAQIREIPAYFLWKVKSQK